jgi:solute carrier family 35 protein E1
MACSADFNANFLGLVYAFGSAILFVTQNIVSKKLFNEAAIAESEGTTTKYSKPDKLNLLCYSSGLAFLFTLPIWVWSEGLGLLSDFLQDASLDLSNRPGSLDHGQLTLEFIFNGIFHFGQNIVAFVLLSMVSPVTYSVASLIKRVFVIVFAIVWFGKSMTQIQGFGFALTFFGLYLYDRMSDADKADRQARLRQSRQNGTLLPITTDKLPTAAFSASPAVMSATNGTPSDEKRNDNAGPGRPRGMSKNRWLPPGTKQEDTWRSTPPYNQGTAVT